MAGGSLASCRGCTSLRHSNDIDFFHDCDEAVTTGAKLDRELLTKEAYKVTTLIEQPSFVRATISKGKDSLKFE